MANSAIQISWLLQKPTDLDLHCLQNRIYPGSAGQGLTSHLGYILLILHLNMLLLLSRITLLMQSY